MPDLFDIPKGDLSLFYLGQIFGIVGTTLPINNPVIFLSGLFKVINTIALTVGAFVLVYITVVGLLATAHEGEFLGKKWSGLWVPIRTVLGVASLFPASTGYSAIQVVVMWIIVQGVGAADMLWKAAVGYTINVGSPYSSFGVSTITTSPTIQALFQGLVCQETASVSVAIPSKNSGIQYYNKGYKPNYTLTSGATTYQMGPPPGSGSCGTLTYCNKNTDCTTPDSPTCWACEAQGEVLPQILTFLAPFAQQYVKTDTDYVVFSELGGKAPDWILDYCKSNSVPEAQCCRIAPNSSTTCASGIWKKDFDPDNSANSDQNIGKDATKMYESWSLYPYVTKAGQGPVDQLPSPASNYDIISVATNLYTTYISTYIADKISTLPPPVPSGWQQNAIEQGWITAGSYYYQIAQTSANNMPNPTFNITTDGIPSGEISGYRNNYSGVNYWLNDMAGQSQAGDQAGPAPPSYTSAINQVFDRARGDLLSSFMNGLNIGPNDNPLAKMSTFGNTMLNTAQYTYLAFAVTAPIVAGGLSFGNFVAVGTGYGNNPFIEGFKTFIGIATPLMYGVLSALFTFGALLALYIPLIPYVVFTVTVLGWFIATIEAMVAAPIIALGILGPGGQHELLGRAEPSLMIIFNLFLRPTLMVMGLMASMLLASIMIRFINQAFLNVVYMALGSSDKVGGAVNLGPGQEYVAVACYVFLMLTVMNKVFSLIHLLPERVLTYIGGHAIQYGEGEATTAVKHGMEAAAGAAAAGAKGGIEAGQAGGEKTGKAFQKKSGGPEMKEGED